MSITHQLPLAHPRRIRLDSPTPRLLGVDGSASGSDSTVATTTTTTTVGFALPFPLLWPAK